ncbi:MAG: hypothetical protein IPM06_17370 [Rhizobiales bacterium]|nr:hypothetical protein [Hyphomicrobiales bacterium]
MFMFMFLLSLTSVSPFCFVSDLSVPRDQRQLIAGQILCIGGAIGRLERSPAPTILLPEVIDLLRSS